MKIVVTATAPQMTAAVDPRFGRGAYFLVVDTETGAWQASPNPARESAGGAGSQAAQYVVGQGAKAVVSGDFGPNAHAVLQAAGIGMYLLGPTLTAQDAGAAFQAGTLEQVGNNPTGPARHTGHQGA